MRVVVREFLNPFCIYLLKLMNHKEIIVIIPV